MAMEGSQEMDRLACPCCGRDECTQELRNSLAALEKEIGELRVTSGFRCPSHNQTVGGVSHSKHLIGKAVDVLIPADVADRDFIDAACRASFNGIGMGNRWAHLDRRSAYAIWSYGPTGNILPYNS